MMLESLLIVANCVFLVLFVLKDYLDGKTAALMSSFNNYFIPYFFTVFLFWGLMIFSPSISPGGSQTSIASDLAKGDLSIKSSINLVPVVCGAAFFIFLLFWGILVAKAAGKNSLLTVTLYLFSLGQQLWFAFTSANSKTTITFMALWYFAGVFVMLFGATFVGKLIKHFFPTAQSVHAKNLADDPKLAATLPKSYGYGMQYNINFWQGESYKTARIGQNPLSSNFYQFTAADVLGVVLIYSFWVSTCLLLLGKYF